MKTLPTLLLGFAMLLPSLAGSANETVTASTERMTSRFYRINPDKFVGNLRKSASPNTGESNQDLLVRFFKQHGVELKKPAAVLLDEERRVLSLTTTQADYDKIERLLIQKKLLSRTRGRD